MKGKRKMLWSHCHNPNDRNLRKRKFKKNRKKYLEETCFVECKKGEQSQDKEDSGLLR